VPTGLSAPPTASMNPSWDSHSQRLLIDRLVIRPSTRATHHEQVANARAHATDRGPMRVTCRICRTVLLSTRPNWRMLKDQVLLSRPREASFAGVLTRCPHGRLDPSDRGHGPAGRLNSRRGASREATLALLAERPMHGYQVMQELGERSGGRWRPSAGFGLPDTSAAGGRGLVTVEDRDGHRTFDLTEVGRTAAAAIPAVGPRRGPWRLHP